MTKRFAAISSALVLVIGLGAAFSQTIKKNIHVSVLGNSIANFENGLQSDIFPLLPAASVFIYGHNGYTCSNVRTTILFDAFGTVTAPRNPDVVVLIDTTNDWQHGTPVNSLMACLAGTAQDLLTHKPSLQIVFVTTLPYVENTPPGCPSPGDQNWLIAQYNEAMPALATQFPHNVTVVDGWTPFVLHDGSGWGDPAKLTGPCGIHPGPPGVWSGGQPILAAVYNYVVMNFAPVR